MKKLLISTALVGVAFAFTQPAEAKVQTKKKAPATVTKTTATKSHGHFRGPASPGVKAEAGGADRSRIPADQGEAFKLSISGEAAFEASGAAQSHRGSIRNATPVALPGAPAITGATTSRTFTQQTNQAHHFSMADANIAFTVSSQNNIGLLGATVKFDALGNKIRNGTKAYISLEETAAGSVYLGNVNGPANVLLRNGWTMQAGKQNFDANWSDTVFVPSGALISSKMAGDTKTATKIAFYTPTISGLQLAVSYTPNAEHRGNAPLNERAERNEFLGDVEKGKAHTNKPFVNTNIIELAANFAREIAGVKIDATAAMIYGKTKDRYVVGEVDSGITTVVTPVAGAPGVNTYVFPLNRKYRDITAYTVGGTITYANITVGGGFMDNLKTNTVKASNFGAQAGPTQGGKLWNAGIGYRMGKTYVSGEYSGSTRKYRAGTAVNGTPTAAPIQRVSTDFYAVAGEHKLAPGMLAYAQVGTFKIDSRIPGAAAPGSSNRSNKGSTFTLGSRLLF